MNSNGREFLLRGTSLIAALGYEEGTVAHIGQGPEEVAIRDLFTAYAAARRSGSGTETQFFGPDADVESLSDRGRRRDFSLTVTRVRFIRGDVALIDATYCSGDPHCMVSATTGRRFYVLSRYNNGQWLIACGRRY